MRNRLDGAKELKKLVYFSNIVVSPLLEDLLVRRSPLPTPPGALRATHIVRICLEHQARFVPTPGWWALSVAARVCTSFHCDAADEGGAGGGGGGGPEGARGRRGQGQGQGGQGEGHEGVCGHHGQGAPRLYHAVSHLESASALGHPAGVSTQRGRGSCAIVLRSTRAALREAQHFKAHCGTCCSPTSHQQARLQAKEAADKEKADEAAGGKAAAEVDGAGEGGEAPAGEQPPATEDAAKQQAEAEGKTVEVQPELPADAAPETGACYRTRMGLSGLPLRLPEIDFKLQHGGDVFCQSHVPFQSSLYVREVSKGHCIAFRFGLYCCRGRGSASHTRKVAGRCCGACTGRGDRLHW